MLCCSLCLHIMAILMICYIDKLQLYCCVTQQHLSIAVQQRPVSSWHDKTAITPMSHVFLWYTSVQIMLCKGARHDQ